MTSANTDERATTLAMLDLDPDLLSGRVGQVLMGDNGYRSAPFEIELNNVGITLIRPSLKSENHRRPGEEFLKPFRQIIEPINQTFKVRTPI